jgi:hypothetical protein
MKITDPLNQRQAEVLGWILGGCPDGVMTGSSYKTTAAALQSRRLVEISRRGGMWSATVTTEGRYYLEHGRHPDLDTKPEPVVLARVVIPTPSPPSARPKPVVAVAPGGKAAAFVREVQDAGGELRLEGYDERQRGDRLLTLANRHGKCPDGMQLVSSWESGSSIVRLVPLPAWMSETLTAVPVPAQLRRLHPTVAALRERDSRFGTRGQVGARGLRLLQGLVQAAESSGLAVQPPPKVDRYGYWQRSSSPKGMVVFAQLGHEVGVEIDVVGAQGARRPQLADGERPRLRVTVEGGRMFRQSRWADGQRQLVEESLPEVLQEVQLRLAGLEEAQIEQQRQAELRRQRWEQAMVEAREAFSHARRVSVLERQVQDWQTSVALQAYVVELEQRVGQLDGSERENGEAWLGFAQERLAQLDPFSQPIEMPEVPNPSAEDLRPHLHGWHPYGPT